MTIVDFSKMVTEQSEHGFSWFKLTDARQGAGKGTCARLRSIALFDVRSLLGENLASTVSNLLDGILIL